MYKFFFYKFKSEYLLNFLSIRQSFTYFSCRFPCFCIENIEFCQNIYLFIVKKEKLIQIPFLFGENKLSISTYLNNS